MRFAIPYLISIALLGVTGVKAATTAGFPLWAFPPCDRTPSVAEPGGRPLSVAGSKRHFSEAQLTHASITPDWFPLQHSQMPGIVAHGHSGKIACGYCHLADGNGRPENAKIAGLPVAYIIAQVKSIRSEERQPSKPGWEPSALMKGAIAELSDQEISEAAEYFSRQKTKKYLQVIERELVPRHANSCGIFIPADGPPTRLHEAILEMPVDAERFERRDPHTSYIAYVPKGSIDRGRQLTGGGGGRTQPCAGCHGADLRSGPELEGPPLAGRFASYLFRQLYGFQSGARSGIAAEPMQSVVEKLTQSDMIDLAAYAASLSP